MPYLEISDSKLFQMIQQESDETQDDEFINKLIKLNLKLMKDWPPESVDITILKRMIKIANRNIKELESMEVIG